MKCLLVIDVQNGFVSPKTEYVVPRILELIEQFKGELVVATKFLNYQESPYFRFMGWERLTASPETDIIPEVENNYHHPLQALPNHRNVRARITLLKKKQTWLLKKQSILPVRISFAICFRQKT